MTNPAIDIPNLLYRYADFMDAGDFAGAAAMFENGYVVASGNKVAGQKSLEALWESWVKLYDGKPQTRHLISNPIIQLSEDGTRASCQSQWTVLQAANDLPLQIIGSGRYEDEFHIIDGRWHFTKRVYAGMDLIGDMSHHILQTLQKEDA